MHLQARAATGGQRPKASHGCPPVEVLPGLWTAHFHDIEDREALLKAAPGITAVVNCAISQCPTKPGSYGDGIEVILIDLLDDPDKRKKVDAMSEGAPRSSKPRVV